MSQIQYEISDDLKQDARKNADTSHCDSDRGRTEEDHKIDAPVGYIAEKTAKYILQDQGYSVKDPHSRDHDLIVNGSKVEIKGRKTWNYSTPDLLIRKTYGIECDTYIQVDLHTERNNQLKEDLSNLSHATIVGFVGGSDIHRYGEPFLEGKQNDTELVPRDKLRPIQSMKHFL